MTFSIRAKLTRKNDNVERSIFLIFMDVKFFQIRILTIKLVWENPTMKRENSNSEWHRNWRFKR